MVFYFHDLFSVNQQGQVNGRNQPAAVCGVGNREGRDTIFPLPLTKICSLFDNHVWCPLNSSEAEDKYELFAVTRNLIYT
jgi:hypothetical protein